MELLPLLPQLIIQPASDTLGPPRGPFLQDLSHAHDLGVAADQDVEVAGKAVLEGGHLHELGHELIRVRAPLQINGQLQAREVCLVPHIADFPDPARLDELGHLVDDDLCGGGIGDLINLDQVPLLHVAPPAPDLDAAPAGLIDGGDLIVIVDQLSAGGKVRGQKDVPQIAFWILDPGHGGGADLPEIEAADIAGHTHGDAVVGGDQHVGEGGGQQGGLLHGAVIVVHKIHGVVVDIPEQLLAEPIQLCLGIPGGGIGHVPGIGLAEVALGIHKGMEQRFIPPA